MAFRFYNGGNAEDLTLSFSVDENNPRSQGAMRNARHVVRIESHSFFEVPETLKVAGKTYFTNFDQTVITRKGQHGVIRVDPDAEETAATGPIARTDEDARKLGDKMHEEYLIRLVQEYKDNVDRFRAEGLSPKPAQGYTKYALKTLNIEDPAEPVRNHVVKAAENERITELEAQLKQVLAALAKKDEKKEK